MRVLSHPPIPQQIIWVIAAVLFFNIGNVAADIPEGAVLIDGLAVHAGSRSIDEADSITVFLSDVEFEAALLLVIKHGPTGVHGDLDEKTRLKARRSAVLIRMLARQAKQFQEVVSPEDIAALKDELTVQAGGPEAMTRLLARFGMSKTHLENWVQTALLATTQIRYIEEQADIPSDGEIADRFEQENPYNTPTERQDAYEAYRRTILQERKEQLVKSWLEGILAEGRVRIIK